MPADVQGRTLLDAILAVPSTVKACRLGRPEAFSPVDLSVLDEQVSNLKRFCSQHGIDVQDEPHWWLSSYWG